MTELEATEEGMVEALAPIMPLYNLTPEEWLGLTVELRMLAGQGGGRRSEGAMAFLYDVARAADAMHNHLRPESSLPGFVYTGREPLERGLMHADMLGHPRS